MLEHIIEQSKAGWSGNKSIVDTLLDSNWCNKNDLLQAYDILSEETESDKVMVFFQLPSLILLPEEWIKFKTEYTDSQILFKTIGANNNTIEPSVSYSVVKRNNYNSHEITTNAYLPGDQYGFIVRTQVIIQYPIWGKRRQHYYRGYLDAFDRNQHNSVLIDAAKSWAKDHRPLTAIEYELELLRRIYLETVNGLRRFIPVYNISCNDPYTHAPATLNSFFMMSQNGRIVTLGPGKSFIAEHVKPLTHNNNHGANLVKLNDNINSKMKPSIYEQYMLEAFREVDQESYNLSVVHTVMILEWFANEIIRDRIVSVINASFSEKPEIGTLAISKITHENSSSLFEKYQRYLNVAGIKLEKKLLLDLRAVIELRNKIIHRDQAKAVSKEVALRSISIGIDVIQKSMKALRSKYADKQFDSD